MVGGRSWRKRIMLIWMSRRNGRIEKDNSNRMRETVICTDRNKNVEDDPESNIAYRQPMSLRFLPENLWILLLLLHPLLLLLLRLLSLSVWKITDRSEMITDSATLYLCCLKCSFLLVCTKRKTDHHLWQITFLQPFRRFVPAYSIQCSFHISSLHEHMTSLSNYETPNGSLTNRGWTVTKWSYNLCGIKTFHILRMKRIGFMSHWSKSLPVLTHHTLAGIGLGLNPRSAKRRLTKTCYGGYVKYIFSLHRTLAYFPLTSHAW